jgi:hypothetical protein
MIGASGRAALILFAGVCLCVGGAVQAAPSATASTQSESASTSTDAARPVKHRQHYTRRHSSKTAEKSADDKKKDAPATARADTPASSTIPSAVANANAQLAAADTPAAAAATALTDRANDNVQAASDNTAAAPTADSQVVESDQLNEVDRALQQESPAAQKTVVASTDAQPRPAPVMAASHADSSAWDQSSLIGKIFIGVGALLTLASAARMFMA